MMSQIAIAASQFSETRLSSVASSNYKKIKLEFIYSMWKFASKFAVH